MPAVGAILCLTAAVAFGTMGIFGKLAYDEGVTVATLLAVRFALAAALLGALALALPATRRAVASMSARDVARGLALGAVGYSAQAGAYFTALERLDASLLALVVYTAPAMVMVAAVLLGRDRLTLRAVAALALASGGLALLLSGAARGALEPIGTLLGLAAAVAFSTYVLWSESLSHRIAPLPLAACVCAGAAALLTGVAVAGGGLDAGAVSAAGWGWLAAIAVVSTVAGIALFLAGVRRVGPTAAAILSTAEPVTTVALAYAAFGEALSATQLLGGALVLAAAVGVAIPAPRPTQERPRQPA